VDQREIERVIIRTAGAVVIERLRQPGSDSLNLTATVKNVTLALYEAVSEGRENAGMSTDG
jgi:urease gamma subunit